VEKRLAVPQKLKDYLLLGTYPTYVQRETYVPIFMASLFTVMEMWQQSKCPSTDKSMTNYSMYTQ
jgi:hypothetical protein